MREFGLIAVPFFLSLSSAAFPYLPGLHADSLPAGVSGCSPAQSAVLWDTKPILAPQRGSDFGKRGDRPNRVAMLLTVTYYSNDVPHTVESNPTSREGIGSPQKKENEANHKLIQEVGENARNRPKTSLFPVLDRVHCGISTRKPHARSVQPEKIRSDFRYRYTASCSM